MTLTLMASQDEIDALMLPVLRARTEMYAD